ncbi:DEAD/DEAH box helicase [Noviherbaspirillum pedocola]|uniref:ATP-dependent RNA helicase DeaD n=1 Tax=Noviherbaspirillum pedocola TaxID=2801341 RepID=A0A934W2U9_9BURK|nr:DEAD/DEAH box helicase [Noviherbaspirillum pedocola]MBK4736721.1 DEAD/DEAH box helicase [Noviherbaspirillum pedocola]
MSDTAFPLFADLKLHAPLLRVLQELGYESPSPIQAATIPLLREGRDVLGQAQTGTGKTAAFALPILDRIDIKASAPQALVLAPTRELAIQVAEAFQRYATHIPNFHVLPIYGGQSYGPQLNALRRGVHVVVGTPGRVIDHIERESLDLSQLKTLVLDEADEMLRMGFIDDVETILQRTPASRQTALFSATMPSAIRRIAQTHLRDPAEVTIAAKTGTADNIRQRYWLVSGMHKLDALTRILEAEPFDGMIIFARTKLGTEDLATRLQARGFSAAAINGDMAQQQRERTIQLLKDGAIDILVATDVAARGLDVERISHVINYDVPHDPESYTHRIGRTGRAGRSGEAILFIAPRERNLLKAIERATRQPVAQLALPSIQAVNDVRIARFKDSISETLAAGDLEIYQSLIEDFEREKNVPAIEIAAALAKLARGDVPLLLDKAGGTQPEDDTRSERRPTRMDQAAGPERGRHGFESGNRPEHGHAAERPAFPRKERVERAPEAGKQRFRIAVGHMHGVKPGNIVGAIANEAGLDSKHIGRIDIYDDYSLLDLPDDLPGDLLAHLQTVWVAGQQLRIRREGAPAVSGGTDKPMRSPAPRASGPAAERQARREETEPSDEADRPARQRERSAHGMQAYRIEVGRVHGVKPANIVGAIANEAGLEAKHIGRIDIHDDYSLLDLPEGMPKEVFQQLQTVMVSGQALRLSRSTQQPQEAPRGAGKRFDSASGPRQADGKPSQRSFGGKPSTKPVKRSSDAPKPKAHRKGSKPA